MYLFRDLTNEVVYVNKDKVFTDSRTIAKEFDRRHDHLLRLIKEAIDDI